MQDPFFVNQKIRVQPADGIAATALSQPPHAMLKKPSGAIAEPVVPEKFLEIFLEFVLVFLVQF
jgi:hypothetical protein